MFVIRERLYAHPVLPLCTIRRCYIPTDNFRVSRFFKVISQNCAKATISCVMSVRPYGTIRLRIEEFSLHLIFVYFSKICRENSGFIKSDQKKPALYMTNRYTLITICRSVHLIMRYVSDKILEKIKTRIFCSVTFFFFLKLCLL